MPTATGHTTAIRASQVIGTALYNTSGEEIGKVEDIVLDKTRNDIMFAVVSVGGITTTSHSYHALPWVVLDYNEASGGYVARFTTGQIANGPAVSVVSELTKNDGAVARDAAYRHYKVDKDW